MPFFVHRNIIELDLGVQVSEVVEPATWRQQYEILAHAESILTKEPSQHDLSCAIFQLNRCIDFREKILNDRYKFRKITGLTGKKHHQAMEDLGVIKPVLKSKLDSIRNKLMHIVDWPVPSKEDVLELCEFTWYFLRATDLIASRTVNSLFGEFGNSWIEIKYFLPDWTVDIRAKFSSELLLTERTGAALEIDGEMKSSEDGMIYASGRIVGPQAALEYLGKRYFNVL